jgi:hypothetical protein
MAWAELDPLRRTTAQTDWCPPRPVSSEGLGHRPVTRLGYATIGAADESKYLDATGENTHLAHS